LDFCLLNNAFSTAIKEESLNEKKANRNIARKSEKGSFIHPSIYLFTALQLFCWTLASFQFLNLFHSRQDTLDGGSARRKAAICTHRTAQTQKRKRT
jgi:hypothetical protein